MMKLFLGLLVFLMAFAMTPVFADSLLLTANSFSEFKIGESPIVYGNTTDYDGNPIPGVEIQVGFPSRTILTTTNASGQFFAQSPALNESGNYTIYVSANKGILYTDAQLFFTIPKNEPSERTNSHINGSKIKGTKLDLLGMMNKKMEEQKLVKENNTKDIDDSKLDGQRMKARNDLEQDMESFDKKHESNNPRNAFIRFLAGIDSAVKNIFWHQFLFTEDITDQAKQAKQKALDQGKTTIEATKIFQENASVTKKEITEYNQDLNIRFGNSTEDAQQFEKKKKFEKND